jgi:hypothetical protein
MAKNEIYYIVDNIGVKIQDKTNFGFLLYFEFTLKSPKTWKRLVLQVQNRFIKLFVEIGWKNLGEIQDGRQTWICQNSIEILDFEKIIKLKNIVEQSWKYSNTSLFEYVFEYQISINVNIRISIFLPNT